MNEYGALVECRRNYCKIGPPERSNGPIWDQTPVSVVTGRLVQIDMGGKKSEEVFPIL